MIDLTKPLDLAVAEIGDFLSSVQGNILKGRGRHYTAHILVRFNGRGRRSESAHRAASQKAAGAAATRSATPVNEALS